MKKIIITAVLIALSFSACTQENKEQSKQQKPMALPVSVFEIKEQEAQTNKEYPTIIKPYEEVNVIARVKGVLVKKYFKEGDWVQKDDKLYTIEQDVYKANLNQAKANFTKANKDYERAKSLLQSKSISQQKYDEYKFMYEDAKAKFQQAQIEFDYTQVSAPISGIAGMKHHDIGDLVGTNENSSLLVTITNTNPIHAHFSLSQEDVKRYLQQIRQGDVVIELVSHNAVLSGGVVDYVASKIDPHTDTLQLRAKFSNEEQNFLVGEYAKIRLKDLNLGDVHLIPEKALLKTAQGTFVYVVENNQAVMRPVNTSGLVEEGVIVNSGLKVLDQVIVNNIAKLRPNTPVQIMNKEQ